MRDEQAPAPAPAEPTSLAVVFVHGIGSQARGATLLSWVEPLQRVLAAATGSQQLDVRIASVRGLAGDAPEITLEVTGPQGQEVTWLLTEARWAETFHPSTAAEVLTWAARFTLRTTKRVLRSFSGQLWFVLRFKIFPLVATMFPRESGCIGIAVSLWASLLTVVFGGYVILALVLPYVIALFGLLVLAPVVVGAALVGLGLLLVVQRIPVLGGRVTRLIAGLVTSVGDAQAYRDRAIQAAAMRDVVLETLQELSPRVDKVVVVAHSQGAAISCRLFLDGETAWPALLMTVGAATSLLNQTGSVEAWKGLGGPRWINVWTPLDPVPAGPVGDDDADVRSRMLETVWHETSNGGFNVEAADGTSWLAWVPGVGSNCWSGSPESLVALAASIRPSGVEVDQPLTERLDLDEARRVATHAIHRQGSRPALWVDTPRPRTFTTAGPEEWSVVNRYSVTRDHSSYTTNLTQVQHRLATRLLDLLPATQGVLPEPSVNAEEWHTRRVRLLFMSRLIAVLSAVAAVDLLASTDRQIPLLKAVSWAADHWKQGGWVLEYIDLRLRATLVLVAAGALVFVSLNGLFTASWNAWHRRESLRFVADNEASGIRQGAAGWTFAATYVLLLASTAVWTYREIPSSTFPLSVLWFYPVWPIVWPFVGLRPKALDARNA